MGTEETIKIVAQVETRFDPNSIIGLRQQVASTKQQFSGYTRGQLESQFGDYSSIENAPPSYIQEEYLRRASLRTPRGGVKPTWQPSPSYPGYGYYRGDLHSAEEFAEHTEQQYESQSKRKKKKTGSYVSAGDLAAARAARRQLEEEGAVAEKVTTAERRFQKEAEESAEQKATSKKKFDEESAELAEKIRGVLKKNLGLNEKIIAQLERQLKNLEAQNVENVATALMAKNPQDAYKALQEYFRDSSSIHGQIDELKGNRKSGIFSSSLQHHVAEQLLHGNVSGAGSSALYGIAGGAASGLGMMKYLTNPYVLGAAAIAGAPFAIGGAARFAARKAEPADEFIRGFGNTERLTGSNMQLFDHYRGNDFGLQDSSRWGRLTPQERQKMIRMFTTQGGFGGETATASSLLPAIEAITGFSRTRGFEQEQGMPLFTSQMKLLGPGFRGSRENNIPGFVGQATKELNKYFDQSLKYQVSSEEALQSILSLQESFASKGIVLDKESVFDLSRVLGTLNATGLPMLQGAQGASAVQGLMDPGMGMMPFAMQWISSMGQEKKDALIKRHLGIGPNDQISPELRRRFEGPIGNLNLAKSILGEGGFPSTKDTEDFLKSLPPELLNSPAGMQVLSNMSPAMRLRLQAGAAQQGGNISTLLKGELGAGKSGADVTGELTRRKEEIGATEAANQLATALIAASKAVDNFRGFVSGTGKDIKGGIANTLGYESLGKRMENTFRRWGVPDDEEISESIRKFFGVSSRSSMSIVPSNSGNVFAAAIEANEGKRLSGGKWAVSSKGAKGPRQMMPSTFEELKRRGDIPSYYDIDNPDHNRIASDVLLGQLNRHFGGDRAKVAAGYIAGQDDVDTTVRTRGSDWLSGMTGEVRSYVDKVLSTYGTASGGTSVTVPITINTDNAEFGDRLRGRLDRDIRKATAEELARDREVAERNYKDQSGHASN